MSKFKRGDTVRRTGCAFGDVVEGGVYTINHITNNGWFNLQNYPVCGFNTYPYNERHFELYQEHLTPAEILQCIIDNVPLELRAGGEWKPVVNAQGISAWNMLKSHYRKLVIPPTILINGTEVPKPLNLNDKYPQTMVYTLSSLSAVCALTPQGARTHDIPAWATREDAQLALDAIKSALKGE